MRYLIQLSGGERLINSGDVFGITIAFLIIIILVLQLLTVDEILSHLDRDQALPKGSAGSMSEAGSALLRSERI